VSSRGQELRPVDSRFSKLARTHAAMAAGDAAMAVALADSVLFSIDADAARGRVLLFLAISFVPFLFVAPLIGPAIDRMAGGRRLVIQIVTVLRVGISIAMAFYVNSLLLFPLAFGAMVLQKTYAISKSALVPSVVRSEAELVEANSKLGLISGLVGFIAVLPAAALQKGIGTTPTLLYSAAIFGVACMYATRLPREVVAARSAGRMEKAELNAPAVVLASTAMLLARATVGFTFFHLFFWFRRQDAGLIWFGLSIAFASLLTMGGNAVAPYIRKRMREETMLVCSLAIIAAGGVGTAVLGGVLGGVLLAGSVNFSAAIGRLAFESILQSDAPDANRGRAFAQFETRFQLVWVAAGVVAVLLEPPGRVGFITVGLTGTAACALYVLGTRAVREGRPPPQPLKALRAAGANRQRRAPTRPTSRARQSTAPSANRSAIPPPPPRGGRTSSTRTRGAGRSQPDRTRGRSDGGRPPRPLAPPTPPRTGRSEP
jgi:hypothetical protein